MSTQGMARVTCQQCGITAEIAVRVDIKPNGSECHYTELPDGWVPVWVPDDAKTKLTCGGCFNEVPSGNDTPTSEIA